MVIPLQYKILAGILAATACFGTGYMVRGWKADADMAKVERKLQDAADKLREQGETASDKVAQSDAALDRQSYNTRTIIEREYRNVEVPADCAPPVAVVDGLRASVESANRAASGTTPALPDASANP